LTKHIKWSEEAMLKHRRTRIVPLWIAVSGISALLLGQIHISGAIFESALLMAAEEPTAETDNSQKPKEGAADAQKEVGKKTETTKFLADRHKDNGIACAGCHKEDPPAKETPTAVCLSCHPKVFTEGTKSQAAKATSGENNAAAEEATAGVDPHLSHMTGEECGACHHAHKESEDLCQSCHDFGFKIP
jgi:hypothetical protein